MYAEARSSRGGHRLAGRKEVREGGKEAESKGCRAGEGICGDVPEKTWEDSGDIWQLCDRP